MFNVSFNKYIVKYIIVKLNIINLLLIIFKY